VWAKKLRNIFYYKYTPILKEWGVKVYPKREVRKRSDGITEATYSFLIYTKWKRYFVEFKDFITENGVEPYSVVHISGICLWGFPGKLKGNPIKDDWRLLYGRLNTLMSRILVEVIAQHILTSFPEPVFGCVYLPGGSKLDIKFNLSKVEITHKDNSGRETTLVKCRPNAKLVDALRLQFLL